MPHPIRRRHALLAAAATGLAAPRLAGAQGGSSWPSRPITITVPNPPGGGTDFAARLYQDSLTRQLGQQVLIDNRPGGNGNIAILHAVRSPPDGHTLLLQYSAFHAGNPIMIRNAGWEPRDLAPVGMATVGPHGIFVAPTVPANTLAEFIAWAKERPGRINYASAGVGSVQHIAALRFSQAIGVRMEHVTYRGAAAALQDVAGGRIEMFVTTPSSAIGLVQGGRVKALAIASERRIGALPNLPTTAEAGMPGFVADAWFAVFAPAGTPAPVVERVNAAMRAATEEPDVRRRAEEGGVFLRPLTVAEMEAVARREVEVLGRFIRENAITME
jgi:tripartite-type tricarboxylate transporter receptor subunit TctC